MDLFAITSRSMIEMEIDSYFEDASAISLELLDFQDSAGANDPLSSFEQYKEYEGETTNQPYLKDAIINDVFLCMAANGADEDGLDCILSLERDDLQDSAGAADLDGLDPYTFSKDPFSSFEQYMEDEGKHRIWLKVLVAQCMVYKDSYGEPDEGCLHIPHSLAR